MVDCLLVSFEVYVVNNPFVLLVILFCKRLEATYVSNSKLVVIPDDTNLSHIGFIVHTLFNSTMLKLPGRQNDLCELEYTKAYLSASSLNEYGSPVPSIGRAISCKASSHKPTSEPLSMDNCPSNSVTSSMLVAHSLLSLERRVCLQME